MGLKIIMMNKNLNLVFLISFISFWFSGCSQPTLEEKRKLTILNVVDLIKKNDTTALFKIIDTAHVYKAFGKENYFNSINKIHKKFSSNQILDNINSENIKVLDEIAGTSYEILLYTSENKSKFYRIIMRFLGNEYITVYSFQSNYNNNSEMLEAPPNSHFK